LPIVSPSMVEAENFSDHPRNFLARTHFAEVLCGKPHSS